jgi:hypothetical protein
MVFAVLFCIAGFSIIFVDRGTFKEVLLIVIRRGKM